MHPMAINRRCFIAGLTACGFYPYTSSFGALPSEARFAANIRDHDGSYAAVAYSTKDGLLRKISLPDRGHDLTYNTSADLLVAFARRPGNFAVAFDIKRRSPPQRFVTPPDRHFYGHGIFSADGRLLYTTENDFKNAVGVIGIYDVGNRFKRIGEYRSYGTGPHDINLLSDGRTLVIANGGIETHPDHGREPLNLATMRSSLVYVDCETGDLLEHHKLAGHRQKLSIRHLGIAVTDTVVFGCQFKGVRSQAVELIGFHRRGNDLAFLPMQASLNRALRQYVSSISVDRSGEIAGITSASGQQIVFVDIRNQSLIGMRWFPDVSGIAAHPSSGFVLTGGHGDMAVARGTLSSSRHFVIPKREYPWAWDNHAISL